MNKSKLLKDLGVNDNIQNNAKSINELLKSPPGLCLAKSKNDCKLNIGDYEIPIKKNTVICTSISQFCELKDFEPCKDKFIKFFRRYSGQNLDNKKLLIIRAGGIGDLMFSQPILKYIKEKYPTCKITYATMPNNFSLFMSWPSYLVDNICMYPFVKDILDEHDYHLVFEGCIERCDEVKKINYYGLFKKMSGLSFNINDYFPTLVPDNETISVMKSIIPDNMVLIQMFSSSELRKMNTNKWKIVVNKLIELGYNVGIIDSPNRSSDISNFIKKSEFDKNKVINLAEVSSNISIGISISSMCVAGICMDSAFVHILSALNKPVVGLYGPFNGELTHKYYKNSKYVELEEFDKCGKYKCYLRNSFKNDCPYIKNNSLPGCYDELDEKNIISSFLDLINLQ